MYVKQRDMYKDKDKAVHMLTQFDIHWASQQACIVRRRKERKILYRNETW
jgi:hypothetical protein